MRSVVTLISYISIIFPCVAEAAKVSINEAIVLPGYQSMKLVCTVSGLYQTEIEEQNKLIDQINFKVGEEDKPIARKAGSNDSDYNLDLYWELNDSTPNLVAETSEKYKINYNVTIRINNGDKETIKKLAKEGKIPIEALFQYKGKNGSAVEGKGFASLFLENPIEAPEKLTISSLHKGLNIKWEVSPSVTHTDGKSYHVSNVLVMLFKDGESEIDLAGKKAMNAESEDPDFSGCRYIAGEDDCIQCDDQAENVYITAEQGDQQNQALIFKLASSDKGALSFNNLDANASYTVALQYEDGLSRSMCKVGNTILSLSLTEANGEKEGELTDQRCFIATATFGSPEHRHVEVFRWFRSSILLRTELGKAFVAFYYKNSPALASVIAESESLKLISRSVLIVPAYFLHGLRLLSQNYFMALGLIPVLASLIFAVYGTKRLTPRRKP